MRAADFFASEADCDAFRVRKAHERSRRAHAPRPHVRALGTFARALHRMTVAEQRAALAWLVDRFLGIRL
jgi:hypothetical protein